MNIYKLYVKIITHAFHFSRQHNISVRQGAVASLKAENQCPNSHISHCTEPQKKPLWVFPLRSPYRTHKQGMHTRAQFSEQVPQGHRSEGVAETDSCLHKCTCGSSVAKPLQSGKAVPQLYNSYSPALLTSRSGPYAELKNVGCDFQKNGMVG